MKLTNNQLQFIINSNIETVVFYLQKDYQMPILEAFDTVYNSKIYQKLVNLKTGLYLKSPDYIYNYLKEELPDGDKKSDF